jgi:hypothetical protein
MIEAAFPPDMPCGGEKTAENVRICVVTEALRELTEESQCSEVLYLGMTD